MARPNADFEFNASFEVNTAKPLDTRTVVDYYSDLSSLEYSYSGLFVYVKSDSIIGGTTYTAGFYYYNGVSWSKFEVERPQILRYV